MENQANVSQPDKHESNLLSLEKRLAKIATANLEELKLKARHVYTGSDGAVSDIGIAKSRLRPSCAQRQAGLEAVMAQKNDMTIRLRYLTWKPRAPARGALLGPDARKPASCVIFKKLRWPAGVLQLPDGVRM
jgi:hypothetical protein